MNKPFFYLLLLIPLLSFYTFIGDNQDNHIIPLDTEKIIVTKTYEYNNYNIDIYPIILLNQGKIASFQLYLYFPYDSTIIMPDVPEKLISIPQFKEIRRKQLQDGWRNARLEDLSIYQLHAISTKEELRHMKKEMYARCLLYMEITKNHQHIERGDPCYKIKYLNCRKDKIMTTQKTIFRDINDNCDSLFSLPGWLKILYAGELNIGDTLEIRTLYNYMLIPIDTLYKSADKRPLPFHWIYEKEENVYKTSPAYKKTKR